MMGVYFSFIYFFETLLCIILTRCSDVNPRAVSTRYGECKGMIKQLGSKLQPVEIFNGFQYASTKSYKMRYMPPTGSLEKWLSVRVFSYRRFRSVCPQIINSSDFLRNRLRNIEPFVLQTSEECLNLNLYILVKG